MRAIPVVLLLALSLALTAGRPRADADAGRPGDTAVAPALLVCPGDPVQNCDDDNPCTDDLCDPGGCRHVANALPCADGNDCTTADACDGGACVGGSPARGCSPCQAAAAIPSQGGTFVGTTTGADTLPGSCGGSGSPERIYAWIPELTGTATIETCGTGTTYDSVVHVRRGGCAGAEVACNDDTPGCSVADGSTSHGSRVRMPVTAGQTYSIVVDGYAGRSGTYRLTVTPPGICGNGVREASEQCDGGDGARCPNGSCSTACTCLGPLPDLVPEISDVGVQLDTTVSAGDVAEGCAEASSGVDLLRFSVRSRNNGTADLALGNPRCPSPCTDHPLAICGNPHFICSPAAGHNHPHYVNYARYELLDPQNLLVVAGHKQGFCLRDTNCADPFYTCGNQGISAGCSDVYGSTLGCQYLDVTGVPPGQYTLRVLVDPFDEIAELDETNNVKTVGVTIPDPGGSGGACTAPTPVPAAGGTFTGVTAGGSTLAGSCGTSGASPERVFQWTPLVSGRSTIQTCGTGTRTDTVLYLRSGNCRTGAEVACNDDAPCAVTGSPSWGSRLTPLVTAGQTYFVVVDGYGGRSGAFALTVVPPGSNPPGPGTCANPLTVPPAGGTVTGRTSGTSNQAGACSSTLEAPEHVYAWTPSASGTATIGSCGSGTGFDTVLYVRRGGCAGSEVACNDDTVGCAVADGTTRADRHGSRVTLPVTAGETYFVVIDGYAGRSGNYTLTFSQAGACAGTTVIPPGGGVFTGTTAGASTVFGSCGGIDAPDKLFQWAPARSGTATIQTCGTGTRYDTLLHVRRASCTGTEVACNDDTVGCAVADGTARADRHGSRVTLPVTAGETYFIVVDGYADRRGAFRLAVTPP